MQNKNSGYKGGEKMKVVKEAVCYEVEVMKDKKINYVGCDCDKSLVKIRL